MNNNSSKSGCIFEIIFGFIWGAMGLLMWLVVDMSTVSSVQIPRFMTFFYDIFGFEIGVIIQTIIGILLIVHGIYRLIKRRK
ncbi:tetrahydromethanopterin S-methyltransferase subunit B [Breznakia sp. PF5-3]|uniref:hypothetical protein n=1 Tax=unclassified Breznakia TaxID=2623764 RepID=UPI0024062212|nr:MULTISPECIES: hypothetical protein [unclassified Breznakia]MDL2276032.1 hypothetical protein [Breznakia sp. OttesenSCG-928-G09]MDF9824325.1 tetrahydromethanopterin S-methyltransferase subunit B [Breznakia sp. PM6-1]MDF9835084.1 tetrahydromethanopterin S-methyltransferase subunit B [Breznakia sp. PF5-3]MDF9838456.1 tetrahydromethanopterin S-methyltransferase subunit B [Breznakia sp. PFB2-8]MDF9860514.1 tetrahydromethanopterin S-methyltransferase subunit B [Breznakia sp. PH5-24]